MYGSLALKRSTVAALCGVTWVCRGVSGAADLPRGDAKPVVEAVCSRCHSLDKVTATKRTRDDWRAEINKMMQQGARLDRRQAEDVVAYLAFNFGVKDRARDLFEDICSSCHSLARISQYEYTKEQWREETKGMISEGNPVNDEELDILLNYLAKNFGPKGQQ